MVSQAGSLPITVSLPASRARAGLVSRRSAKLLPRTSTAAIGASVPSLRKSRVVSVLTAQRWTKRWPPRVGQVPLVVALVID
jgi:hypothetical protein